MISAVFRGIDWWLFLPAVLITGAGILTMNVFEGDTFALRQLVWLGIAVVVSVLANYSTLTVTLSRVNE